MSTELHNRFAEVSPQAFERAFFQDGHDLSEDQLTTLGDFSGLPFLQEGEIRFILVRHYFLLLSIRLIVRQCEMFNKVQDFRQTGLAFWAAG